MKIIKPTNTNLLQNEEGFLRRLILKGSRRANTILLFSLSSLLLAAGGPGVKAAFSGREASFTENKGQVKDQNQHARPDVLFSGEVAGMSYHLLGNGISYQFNDPRNKQQKVYRLD